jgi:hypothetical protein
MGPSSTRWPLFRAAAVASLAAVVSCSSSGSGAGSGASAGACQAYTSAASLTHPQASLWADVLPVFQGACSAQARPCHGDPVVTVEGRPFLGLSDGGTDPGLVVQQIVGVPSKEDPSMNLVTAGDPAQSYLMHKLDDDQCTLAPECMKGGSPSTDCGWFMPYRADAPLPPPVRDSVRRWIAQGALNN